MIESQARVMLVLDKVPFVRGAPWSRWVGLQLWWWIDVHCSRVWYKLLQDDAPAYTTAHTGSSSGLDLGDVLLGLFRVCPLEDLFP